MNDDGSDNTAVEQIESIYAHIGLATAHDRAQFLIGNPDRPLGRFDVVISTSSEPFTD